MSHRSLVVALLAALALAAPARAEDPAAAKQKRGAYVVKYTGARDLALVLAKHFKGVAEISGTGNTLLVSAAPDVFDEVMKVVELLDRKPQSVAVEVFVVELPTKKADGKDAAAIDEKELTGAIDDVAKALTTMQRKGQVAAVKRIQLTTQEGQSATLSVGENKPYTTGSTITATGLATRSIAYRSTGTIVGAKPAVAADGSVTIDLNFEDSRMVFPESGVAVGEEKGKPVIAPEFTTLSFTSKVAVASGKAVLAKDEKSTAKSGVGEVLIVVGARVLGSK
jgi:type II secretory pathway component GspD/PulD (secretin)